MSIKEWELHSEIKALKTELGNLKDKADWLHHENIELRGEQLQGRRVGTEIEVLTRQVADIKAALPDDFTESKDWAFDSDPVSRIEWLKSFHAQHRVEIERLEDQSIEQKADLDKWITDYQAQKEKIDRLEWERGNIDAAMRKLSDSESDYRNQLWSAQATVAEQRAEIERLSDAVTGHKSYQKQDADTKAELLQADDGPGEEDGPWAEGWAERAGLPKPPAGYTAEELERDNPFNQWQHE